MSDRENGAIEPLELFRSWFADAHAAAIPLSHSVCLATATPEGDPSARMVLFRGFEGERICFFTDYRSRKARDLDRNPRAALVFFWQPLDRQVRIEGTVQRLSTAASDGYFASRPRGSRVSAWASHQSADIDDRSVLEASWTEVERRFRGREIPRPPHWGGYGLLPARFEFWQGRDNRLHDRIVYARSGGAWIRTRLQP